MPLASEQEVVAKIAAMHADGLKFREITRRLNVEEKRPSQTPFSSYAIGSLTSRTSWIKRLRQTGQL